MAEDYQQCQYLSAWSMHTCTRSDQKGSETSFCFVLISSLGKLRSFKRCGFFIISVLLKWCSTLLMLTGSVYFCEGKIYILKPKTLHKANKKWLKLHVDTFASRNLGADNTSYQYRESIKTCSNMCSCKISNAFLGLTFSRITLFKENGRFWSMTCDPLPEYKIS